MVKLEMEFKDWKEMQDFFNNITLSRVLQGTVTVAADEPKIVPFSGPALQPTEPTGTEKPKRGRKPKAEAPPPAGLPAAPPPPPAVATLPAGPDITEAQRGELRDALKTFMAKHGLSAAEALLAKYGAKKMMDLKAENFDAFKKDIQG